MAKDTATPDAGNGTALHTDRSISERLDGIDGLFGDDDDGDEELEDGAEEGTRRESPKRGKQSKDRDDDDADDDDELLGDPDDDDEDHDDGLDDDADDEDAEDDEDESDEDSDSGKPAGDGVQPTADSLHEVTLPGGEKAKVTYAELTKGYSREQDYTRKTMALGEKERQYSGLIDQLTAYLEAATAPEQEPDWAKLEAEDPVGFAVQKAKWADLLTERETARQEQARLKAEKEREWERNYGAYLVEQGEKLKTLIPAWKDAKVARRESAALKAYLKDNGFTDEQIQGLNRAEAIVIIRKAALYDRSRTADKGGKPKAKVKSGKRARPGTRSAAAAAAGTRGAKSASDLKRATARLKRTGSVDDAAERLGHIPGLFTDDED